MFDTDCFIKLYNGNLSAKYCGSLNIFHFCNNETIAKHLCII